MKKSPIDIAYIIDPRFPGGTSSAVASELKVVSKLGRISVHAVSSGMFKGANVAPQLRSVLGELNLNLIWDAKTISADIVLLHNPSFLKFEQSFGPKILAKHLVVIAHENFYRADQHETFDVAKCLNLIAESSLTLQKSIAPISTYSRSATNEWLKRNKNPGEWSVLELDWFNICDSEMQAPTSRPMDRRGRHSRAGVEKFPSLDDMDLCFPAQASANVILGADLFLNSNLIRPHWKMIPFRGIDIKEYFEKVDFVVYFASPVLRESFGRVLAESIAAGKVTISDEITASTFNGAVIPAQPSQVSSIIKKFVDDPSLYQKNVALAQETLRSFSSDTFCRRFLSLMDHVMGDAE